MTALVIAAALAVLPTDRLAMADRLFNRGEYAAALTEFTALAGSEGIAVDQLEYRLAECERALGRTEAAKGRYRTLVAKYPSSRFAESARLNYALLLTGEERVRRLKELDSDRVPAKLRAAALYHLGSDQSEIETLRRAIALDEKGTYAPYARLKLGSLMIESGEKKLRLKGLEELLNLAFGGGPLAESALYLAANGAYRDGRYGQAASLFKRYLKIHPKGQHAAEAFRMSVWSDYLNGHYADATAAMGEIKSDDFDYIRAAAAAACGETERAWTLFRKYLEEYPSGKYRSEAELPLARLDFDRARTANSAAGMIESARRSLAASQQPEDALRLAWAYERVGQPDKAAAEYQELARKFPGTEAAAEAKFRQALLAIRREAWAEAELALAEALATGKLGGRAAQAHYWRGIAAMRLGHEREAVELLKAALAEGLGLDESREARLVIADVDYRSGQSERALDAYAKLVEEGATERMSSDRIYAIGRLLSGEPAATCAKALTESKSPAWRQAGWTLLGRTESARAAYAAAMAAYARALDETVTTEAAAEAALALGKLQMRAGKRREAGETLKKAVKLNKDNARARAEAYLALSENAAGEGDFQTAVSYATVVQQLFDDAELKAKATEILKAHPEVAK